ncbi:MAG: tandem-95 repeat protein, partial [Nitrospira sp.]|nr:tandem-95 repeat protein [Nitrospira sp.]
MFWRKQRKETRQNGKPKPTPKASRPARSKASLLSLESRLMFDAAAAATTAEVQSEQVAQEQAEAAVSSDSGGGESQESTDSQDLLQAITAYMPVESRTEVVFVDPTVPNYQELLSGMDLNIEVIMLDGGSDGIEQMAEALAGRTNIDAIHLIGEGTDAQLHLGSSSLTQDSISTQYASLFQQIGQSLSAEADLMIYGSNFGRGDAGQAAIQTLATLTGADVAASTTPTGHASQLGDWTLETSTGLIETAVVVDAETQTTWEGTLTADNSTDTLDSEAIDTTAPLAQYLAAPLAFEENVGQTDDSVDFLARGSGYAVFLTEADAVLTLSQADGTSHVVRLDVLGANPEAIATGESELESRTNYFLGSQDEWRTDIANYGAVIYDNVYDGIDLRYYGNQRQLEYDFIVNAGADTDAIRLSFQGVLNAEIADNGDLLLTLNEQGDQIAFKAPIAFQTAADGSRETVASRYIIYEDGSIGFELGAYDTSRELVIDPVLSYVAFLGGTGYDTAEGIAVDSSGNAYITGWTGSTDFPTTVGALDQSYNSGSYDIYVAKLSATGNSLVYSTFIGGSGNDTGNAIVVDGSGNVYIAGQTTSTDLSTVNAYQGTLKGSGDAVLMKLNSSGNALLYSTYFGGTSVAGGEVAYDLALDSAGIVYLAGQAYSSDMPLKNAYDATLGGTYDAFVAKFDLSQSGANSLLYSSLFGGSGAEYANTIAVDGNGNFSIGGQTDSADLTTVNAYQSSYAGLMDGFVTRFNSAGSAVTYSTYLGGSTGSDWVEAIAIDAAGAIYVGGKTAGGFSTTAGAYDTTFNAGSADGFVVKLDPTQSGAASAVYSTYLGGTGFDYVIGIDVDASGNAYLGGFTGSAGFPTTADGADRVMTGSNDGFFAVLNSTGTALTYSTFLGGSGQDRVLDVDWNAAVGSAYVAGFVGATDGLTGGITTHFGPEGGNDAFVAKFTFNQMPTATANSYTTTEGVAVSGNVITDNTGAGADSDPDGDPLTASLISGPLHGTLVLNSNGSFTYTPYDSAQGTNFASADSFTYQISDGKGGTSSATVSLTVTPNATNEAPVHAVPGAQTVGDVSTLVFSQANGNRIVVRDDAGTNSVQVTLTATNGTITLAGTAGLTFSTGDGTADSTMTFTGTLSAVNTALNGLAFAPGTVGAASLRIITNDQGNSGTGGAMSDDDTIAITVVHNNVAPVNTVPGAQTSDVNGMVLFSSASGTQISVGDADAGGSAIQVTLTAINGTINLPTTKGLTFSVGDGTGDATMTFTGTVSDINAALNGMTFVSAADFTGAASLQIVTNDLGNSGSGGSLSDSDAVNITVREVDKSIWMASVNDVSSPGATGLTSWTGGQVLNFGPSGGSLQFEPGTTTGTFSLAGFNLDSGSFGDGNTQIDALHYVTRNMTVAGFALQKGDLLFSVAANETLGGVAYEKGDIVLFRPTTPGNYSAGTFSLFFDKTDTAIDVTGFTLVEQAVTVGNVTLNAGDLLLVNGASANIQRFVPTQYGDTTAGSASVFIDGAGVNFNKDVAAIDVVEQTTVIGNKTLSAGTLIVSLIGEDTTVGSGTTIAVTRWDLFTLDVTTTGTGTTNATATMLFQGSDVALDNNSEAVQSASLIPNQGPTFTNQTFGVAENSANGTVVGTVTGTDPEGSTVKYAITGGNANGAFTINATTGQITVANTAALDYETTPVFTLTVAAMDADGAYTTATVTVNLSNVNEAPVNTVPGTQTTPQDTSLQFSSGGSNAISIADVDAANNLVQVTLSVSHGTLTLASPGGALDSEVLVTTNSSYTQQTADIAMAADGSYVVVWASSGQDGAGYGVYAQRYNSAGVAQGGEILINTSTTGDQLNPSVAMDDAGNFVVAWQTNHLGTGFSNVYAQRFDASGNKLGSEFRVDSMAGANMLNPDVAMDADGDFIITYEAEGGFDGSGAGIYAHRYYSSGTAMEGAFKVNTYSTSDQRRASVAMDDAGNFVVVWDSLGQDGSGLGVYGQIYTNAKVAVGSEFRVNTTTANAQGDPSVAMDASGNFVVAWEGYNATTATNEIYFQRYNASGAAQGSETQVNTTTAQEQLNASVSMNGQGEFVVAWDSNGQDGSGLGIVARRYTSAGAANGGEFIVNTTTAGSQSRPAAVLHGSGNMVVAWDGAGTGDTAGIFMRRYLLNYSVGDGVSDATMTFSGTKANINAMLNGLVYTPNAGYTGTDTLTITTNDLGSTGSGGALSDVDTVNITVTSVNSAPVLGLPGSAVNYTENDPATIIDATATVTDSDSADFNAGTLTVDFTANGTANDRLAIRNQGTSAGQIGVSGSNVTYGGVVIGTYTGGTGTTPLVITFTNASATPAAVQALVRNITYANVSDAPSTSARTVRFVVTDGDGGTSTAVTETINVAAANDAPVLGYVGSIGLPLTDENTTSSATLISDILISAQITDVDAAPQQGLAVTAVSGNGTFQYSTDGVTWTNFGSVSNANALLLANGGRVRYVPDGNNGEIGSFTYRAWDRTTGAASANGSPSYADTGTGGGTTAYSSQTGTVQIWVNSVNDAPYMPGVALGSTNEDTTWTMQVSTFAGYSSDVDTGALKGLAIVGVDNTNGTWQYTLNGTTWVNIDSGASASNALLLAADATSAFRFVPNANWNGTTGMFQYKAWDQTSGTAGTYVDASVSGGTTAFSGTSGSVLFVNAVNDAPTALSTSVSLGSVAEDTSNPAGATVSALFGSTFSDAKDQVTGGSSANSFAGIAITANTANATTEGKWQWYNGTSWVDVSTSVSTSSALVLSSTTLVRFLPNADYNGTPGTLTARLIDNSSGAVTSGSTVNVTTSGGTTRYSDASNAVTLSTTITPVNDAPVVDLNGAGAGNNVTTAFTEQTPVVIAPSGTLSDVDSANLTSLTATLTARPDGNAVESLSLNAAATTAATGAGLTVSYTASTGVLSITGSASTAVYQTILQGIQYNNTSDTPTTTNRSITVVANDGATSSTTQTATITITPVNDAPVADDDSYSLNEDGSLVEPADGVLLNDADVDGNTITAVLVTGPTHATSFTLNPDGSFTYTPEADWFGTDTFTYKANDGTTDGNVATVTITVNPINDAPTITYLSGDTLAYNEGDGAVVIEQGGNAIVADVDSANFDTGTLTVSFTAGSDSAEDVLGIRNQGTGAGQIGVSGSNVTYGGVIIGTFTGGSGGTNLVITLNSSATPTAVTALVKNITYQNTDTAAPTTGARTVRYVLSDGDGGTSANYDTTVTVSGVNDAPTGSVTIAGTPTEDQTLTASNTLADADGLGAISYQWQRDGVAIVGATASTYTLGDADVGTTITVVASYTDGQGTVESVSSAGVGPIANVNDPPVISVDATPILYLNGTLTIDSTLSVTDVDNTTLQSAQVSFGAGYLRGQDRLLFVNQLGITGSFNINTGVLTLTGTASVADYQTALRSVQYQDINPTPAEGQLYVNFTVSDGTATSLVDTRILEIVDNLPPRAGDNFGTVAEGNAILIDLAANDTDADDALDLTSIVITSGPTHGSVVINGDGTITYTHDGSETTSDSFTYTIKDLDGNVSNEAPVSLAVTPVNDAPIVGTNTGLTVDEGATGTVITTAMLNEGDPDDSGAGLTYTLTAVPSNGTMRLNGTALGVNDTFTQTDIDAGIVTYDHNGSETVSDSFSFSLADGGEDGATAATGTFNITVNPVNDLPIISNLTGDSLGYTEGDGAVVIEQNGDALVADVDSANFDTGTLTVSFQTGSDSAEDVLGIPNQGTGAGQIGVSGSNITYGGTVIGTFTGGSGGTNLVITFNSNATPTAVTALVKNITYENTDTAAPTTGARTVRYVLTDGDGGTSANYDTTVTVTAVNDAPVNSVPGAQTVNEDTPLALSGISVTDVDGNLSTVQLGVLNGAVSVTLQGTATISAGSNGTNSLTLSGSEADINATLATLVYQGNLNYNGADTLTVTSTDANSGTDVDTVAITVNAVNDPTLITGGTSGTGTEDSTITNTLTATDAEGLSDGTVFTV